MSFRVKFAWAMIAAHVVAYGGYFAIVGPDILAGRPPPLQLLAGAVAISIVIIVAGAALSAALRPGEAQAGLDERQRIAILRSESFAGFWLAGACVTAVAASLFGFGVYQVAHIVLAGLVVAEIAKAGWFLWRMRTGF